ncbi:MAG: bifunctional DNA primase/polymerase [Actinomycetota bacterium]
MLTAALAYAKRGCAVFPLHCIVNGRCTCGRDCSSPGKHPMVRRGVHEATTDARVIKEWWHRWRRANIGLATGSVSRIVVIDIDLPRAFGSLDRIVHKLPRTLTALTGGGGVHLLLGTPGDRSFHNHTSSVPGIDGELPGIDVRGDGGYIVAPPSTHVSGARYGWLDPGATVADAPAWLQEPERTYAAVGDIVPVAFDGDGTAYGRAALDSALTSLRSAPVGQRNHTLNRCAFGVAQLVAGGELLESCARAALLEVALVMGLEEEESRQTIDSAFAAGLRQPRVAPHRHVRTRRLNS